MDYKLIANSWAIWLAVIPVALLEIYQAYIFAKKTKAAGPLVGLSAEEANKAFKVGMRSAIGPSLGVFAVMLGLMAVIGAPLAWQRLSIIGAAPTELAAATMAAKAQGLELSSPDYGAINFANACWVMALNGNAWLLTSGLLADKLDKISKKVMGHNKKTLGIFTVAATCGAFGYMCINQVIIGLAPAKNEVLASTISSFVLMVVLERVAKKHPRLGEWTLGIAMAAGMAVAVIFKHLVMGA
ncbi:MAG: DUF5058 family protein [Atopobiaceae bacterium]|uniref:DUF5058 family protein n=1 Tax=Olsenella absiana TaxID=3115222 RepID=A0ABU7RA02_9ACTN|nr:DUF5058 family protein [Olsenella sp.]MDY3901110.1 DUF5058 family protein [Atopobiaceae bacterium]